MLKRFIAAAVLGAALMVTGCSDNGTGSEDEVVPTLSKLGTIDLSSYVAYAGTDSAQTAPHMASQVIVNNKLYVVCQRLKGWDPGDVAQIVVINTSTDAIIKTIDLAGNNPAKMYAYGDKIYVACTGAWYAQDGGIEVIDASADTSEGILVSEADVSVDISADVTDVIVVSETKGYLVKSSWPNSHVVSFSLPDGKVGNTLAEVSRVRGFVLNSSDELYVMDADTTGGGANDGVYIYNAATEALLHGPIDCGLAPNSIAFMGSDDDAYVVTSDYTDGYLSTIDGSAMTTTLDITTVHSDASIFAYGDYLYLVEKLESDKIIKLDPDDLTTKVAELSVIANSNPYSIVFASADKAYVIRYGATNIWIVKP